jgi:cell fate (sporulation/competence/biofilm development) regulator YlbF (YheA/YmcA/DUF963 family)
MNVYDKAYELARSIKESAEYKSMAAARAQISQDADSQRMLDDLRSRQSELQSRMMAGDMPPQEEMERLQKLYEVAGLNPAISRLFDAERRFSVILEDVQRIIAEPLDSMMK